MDDYKKRVQAALTAHAEKHLKTLRPKRKNKKPEKEVERLCVAWTRAKGWQGEVYDAKAQWNPRAGRWLKQTMNPGHSDWAGCLTTGVAAYIEFKAPGRLNKFNLTKNFRQREFIKNKITSNCFAAVVDGPELLELIFTTWEKITDHDEKKAYLISMLP